MAKQIEINAFEELTEYSDGTSLEENIRGRVTKLENGQLRAALRGARWYTDLGEAGIWGGALVASVGAKVLFNRSLPAVVRLLGVVPTASGLASILVGGVLRHDGRLGRNLILEESRERAIEDRR